MFNKKTALGISLAAVLAAGIGYTLLNDNKEEEEKSAPPVIQEKKFEPEVKVTNTVPKQVKYEPPVKKADLYNSTDKHLPLSAIADLTFLPDSAEKTVNNLLKESSGGIYFLKHNTEKAILVLDLTPSAEESTVKRHDFNFVEISMEDGKILNHKTSDENSKYDKWDYDNDLPLSHTHYNENKEIEYTEVWNYADEEPVKYKKTDKDGNVISLRKEVIDNGVNLREEHIFYDEEGNMIKNVSFNYDGVDLTRFTYYDAASPDDSVMVVSDYEDGVKQKETLYSSDYKVKNIYIPEYNEGQKSKIKILDKDNKLIEILVEDNAS